MERHYPNDDANLPKLPAAPTVRSTFSDPEWTATGERRAAVALDRLETLWINTGTLCNITCHNCYIESSPRNDRLAYIARDEARTFLAEAKADHPALTEIGFTGGEPFMNPDILGMIEDALAESYRVLVLTNAMRPMQRHKDRLIDVNARFPNRLTFRVSLDHYTEQKHESLRGPRSWLSAIKGLQWLVANGFAVAVAGRTIWDESEPEMRAGYRRALETVGIALDTSDPERLVLFPEMDERDVPEITEHCWGILHKRPDSVMCAHSRMVVKRKGAARPEVVSCTLLPYDHAFSLGHTLREAARAVPLNHRYCARFCVLGGASCS
jgi:organic radical activating enzyme